MKDEDKTKEQLIIDLRALRRKVSDLEVFEAARIRIEEELLKFSHAVAQSPDAIIITDLSGSIEYVNPKFTEITGYPFNEALGQNPRFLKSGETTDEEYAYLWKTILSGKEWRGVFHNKKKNGELFWEHATISPIRNFEGKITHFIGIKQDITESKRAEEALLESEEKFRKISSSAQDAIIMMDGEGRISFWNEAAERIFGYTFQEAVGKVLHQLVAPRVYRMLFEDNFEHFIKTGHGGAIGKTLEMKALKRSGDEFPIELSLSSVRIKGKWHAVGIVRDISSRRKSEARMEQLQKQLIQSEKMASLGTFASGVAHEIKNPLAIVLQGTEYLTSSLSSDTQLLDVAERIKKAVLRADRIVKGLLNFSRQTPFKFEESDIISVVEDALSNVVNQLNLKNIKTVRSFGPHLLNVMLDKSRISQVLINILLNAADALPEGGTVTISLETAQDFMRISVADNGAGISEENIKNVFDPFFSTKQKDGNAGMGLAITKGIIEGHNGTIDIESRVGEGTSVIIGLPLLRRV